MISPENVSGKEGEVVFVRGGVGIFRKARQVSLSSASADKILKVDWLILANQLTEQRLQKEAVTLT